MQGCHGHSEEARLKRSCVRPRLNWWCLVSSWIGGDLVPRGSFPVQIATCNERSVFRCGDSGLADALRPHLKNRSVDYKSGLLLSRVRCFHQSDGTGSRFGHELLRPALDVVSGVNVAFGID